MLFRFNAEGLKHSLCRMFGIEYAWIFFAFFTTDDHIDNWHHVTLFEVRELV